MVSMPNHFPKGGEVFSPLWNEEADISPPLKKGDEGGFNSVSKS
jgi:hypothetical protein